MNNRRRRLTDQQVARIERQHEERRQRAGERAEEAAVEADETPLTGTVIIRHGNSVVVADGDNRLFNCLLRRNVGHLVCGDRVVWHRTGEISGVVTAMLDRSTVLARPDYSGRKKPIAANISQLVVVIAPEPPPTGYLIDQYLVTAETIGAEALILLNKIDLLADDDSLLERLAEYRRIGYPTLFVSTRQDIGIDAVERAFENQTSILVGQSGVGKSSLINHLLPDQEIQIGALSETTGHGKHTTSATTLYRLPDGGSLIDSPGVRSFRLTITDRSQLEHGFREFRPFLGHCRFNDCHHLSEPGCALTEAVASGDIAAWRLEHFHQMESLLTS